MFWLSFSCCLDGVCVTDFDRGGGTNAFLDVEEDGTEDGGGPHPRQQRFLSILGFKFFFQLDELLFLLK